MAGAAANRLSCRRKPQGAAARDDHVHAAALFYFREVTRAGSIRKAAATLNVAASALNRQILKLEDELGTPCSIACPAACG